MLRKMVVTSFLLTIVSCTSAPTSKPTTNPEATKCPEERVQMCTREYLPVCATRDTGVRCITAPCPSTEEKTYGNGCSACADAKVIEYRAGACEADVKKTNN
ncbi:hypothetical protein GCM10011613_13940 [Cellvibrio zantedeschiae]|uniref:Kazal-like domain-containing protein n=1 Tax=Cellvibrio zantedeschiae TaxID=1237077 RepID=A0ABQ3B1C7_9GAMM|nr:hypothetical protein [Cellvibrio zantedeschiae]GGY70651.1 hypothetical protein GCM10011613_13940 [Cellvibrio zantedeschiae]